MKNSLIQWSISALGALIGGSPCGAQSVQWLEHYGNGGGLNATYGLASDNSGGLYIIGSAGEPGLDCSGVFANVVGRSDAMLLKLDPNGQSLWVRTSGGECSNVDVEIAQRIVYCQAIDGVVISGIYMTAAQFGPFVLPPGGCDGGMDMFLAAYNSAGDCLWATSVNGSVVRPRKLLEDGSEVFVFAGASDGPASFEAEPGQSIGPVDFMARYGTDGSFIDVVRTVRNGNVNDAEWSGNNHVLCGVVEGQDSLFQTQIQAQSANFDGFVAAVGQDHSVQWLKQFKSDGMAIAQECEVTSSGDIVVTGAFLDNLILDSETLDGPADHATLFVARFTETGDLVWLIPIESSVFANVVDMTIIGGSQELLTGRYVQDLSVGGIVLHSESSQSIYLLKIDSLGVCDATLSFGRTQGAGPGGIITDEEAILFTCDYDSTFTLDGWTVPATVLGAPDILVVRFDSLAGFSNVQPISGGGSSGLVIISNPNQGVFSVQLPSDIANGMNVEIRIIDDLGRVVQQGSFTTRQGSIDFNLHQVTKGIYHLELRAGPQRYMGRFVYE